MSRQAARYLRRVYWFRRPPYLRYVAAALLLSIGTYLELRPEPTATHLFAAEDVAVGTVLTEELFEKRAVPRSLFEPIELAGRAAHDLHRGDPLTASGVDLREFQVPSGWWALQVPLPSYARPGMPIQLVVRSKDGDGEPHVVPGLVIASPDVAADPLGFESPDGVVAIQETDAAEAAVAVTERRVTVLLAP